MIMNCAKHEYWAPGYHAGYATERANKFLQGLHSFPRKQNLYIRCLATNSCSTAGTEVPVVLECLSWQKLYICDTSLK